MEHGSLGPFRVEVPGTSRERMRGLRGRPALPVDEGLLVRRCRSVHTFGMRFPIDAVLLDRHDRVVAVLTMPPRRVSLPRPRARHVLEVAAGTAPRVGLRLTWRPAATPRRRTTRDARGLSRR